MASRGSQHPQDEITWQTTGVSLGSSGMDLRQPSQPGSMVDIVNARFVDDRNVRPRHGHTAYPVRDGSDFPTLGDSYTVSDEWVYGHGLRVSGDVVNYENAHFPVAGRGAGTFTFGDSDVVWTGDRLLVVAKDGGTSKGSSSFWSRSTTDVLPRGFPAFLPTQTESHPPAGLTGEYAETCLTETLRAYLFNGDSHLTARIIDRATGTLIDESEISGTTSNNPGDCRVINSDGTIVALWRDLTSREMYLAYWTGFEWTAASLVQSDVYGFDVAPVSDGFHLMWRTGTPSADALYLGKYTGTLPSATPYAFGTAVDVSALSSISVSPIAVDVSVNGDIAIAVDDGGLRVRVFTSAAVPVTLWALVEGTEGAPSWTSGLSIRARMLRDSNANAVWVLHASNGSKTVIHELSVNSGVMMIDNAQQVRQNSVLASKSFRVGDEVFCWLQSANSLTNYLVGGVATAQVCGYADREEALSPVSHDANWSAPLVAPDPLDEDGWTFTWCRPYNTGQSYNHNANVRTGDLDFMPTLSTAAFGRSVYLAGSAVRTFDGVELGDAGWHDYPVVQSNAEAIGGSMDISGDYYFRVYAVRYNYRGERFSSAARTYGPVRLTFGHGTSILTISSVPSTNHDDAVFEVYRTEAGGTAFYLDGTVPNSLSQATVTYSSNRVDSDLRDQTGDSHAPGPGQIVEIEDWGPIGCTTIATSGDRLWTAGGQVPAGFVEFSKLHAVGFGAGFDDLAEFQEVDTEGGDVTLIHRHNDATVAHQAKRLYVIVGRGPDNYGNGVFSTPEIVLADGAVTSQGCVSAQPGTLFWGAEGPRLLTNDYKVVNISAPVRPLSTTLVPSGVRVDVSHQEIVWYTEGGDALLWNYLGETSRWARWDRLHVAGASSSALVTTTGRLLVESEDAAGDGGGAFAFSVKSGALRPTDLLQGGTLVRAIGLAGAFEGPHQVRCRVYYNGSPLWADEWAWHPEVSTWLSTGDDYSTSTPAQIDTANSLDRSGTYQTHKRTSRQECSFFQVEISNVESEGPTFVPYELSLEVGSRGGLARVPVNSFGG